MLKWSLFTAILFFINICQAQKKPNILWLSVEDMSPRLGCYGDFAVPTPNIDRLAKEGVRYTNVFTTAGVCAPSRNAIATGRIQSSNGGHNMRSLYSTYPEKTGLPKSYSVVMPVGVKHFAEYLRADGYYCTNNSKTDYQFEETPTIWDETSTKAHWKNRQVGQPFFAIFNNTGTHESQVWARNNKPLRVDPKKVKLPPYYPDTDSVRLDIARFYTNISEMDDWVGEQIKELENAGLLENTIVMFWSDHGDGLPFFKREVYQRGLKVPLIIRLPQNNERIIGQKKRNTVENRLISSIDFAPTVLSLANLPTPKWMQGKPFLGKYYDKSPHKYVFAARDRMDSEYDRVRSVTDGKFQYVYNFNPEKPYYQNIDYRKQQASMREILRLRDANQLNEVQMQWFRPTKTPEEFFDLENDPFQLNNVIGKANYKSQVNEFRAAFKNWQKNVVDFGAIPEKELVKQMWNGNTEPPKTEMPEINIMNGMVKLNCKTNGASIAYKIITEGIEPKRWEVYQQPIKILGGQKIKSVAQRIGYLVSDEVVVNN